MKGKLIVIEGTDCSGKETQTKMLVEKLEKLNIKCVRLSFPMYDTPTGKIVGGPYLGKDYICDGWFDEGAVNVDPKVSSLYYVADRKYNIGKIEELLNNGVNVILDRYTYSNLAHQGGKIEDKKQRLEMYNWLDKLEFELLELPKADIRVFLHMPYEVSCILKRDRVEKADQHESSKEHLLMAENAYKEIADIYNFKTIECNIENSPKKIEDINKELYDYVYELLEK
ncbi:MAG: thymidylate kinase [Bacilli bacterium]|nr:thymidylate kinase [Bacilli bacterium]